MKNKDFKSLLFETSQKLRDDEVFSNVHKNY